MDGNGHFPEGFSPLYSLEEVNQPQISPINSRNLKKSRNIIVLGLSELVHWYMV